MKKVLVPFPETELESFKDAAAEAKTPFVEWVRTACRHALARDPDPSKAVPQTRPVLAGQTVRRTKISPICESSKCRRIGVPCCDPCRKLNS